MATESVEFKDERRNVSILIDPQNHFVHIHILEAGITNRYDLNASEIETLARILSMWKMDQLTL